MMRRRPPYARDYLLRAANVSTFGPVVALGRDAWTFAQRQGFPVMVLDEDSEPEDFTWPAHHGGAIVHEVGLPADARLRRLAAELLRAGNPFAVAIRHTMLDDDPRVFFYPEVDHDVAAAK